MAPKYNRKKPVQYKPNPNKSSKKTYMIIGLIALIVIIIGAAYVVAHSMNNSNPSPTTTPTATPTSSPVPSPTPATNETRVLLQTSMGNITLQLRDDKPITTTNFLKLVAQGKYDGTVFHRISKTFMIQGGEVSPQPPSIADEIGSYNHNYQYTIAMAKTYLPNSATSGFFINTVDNSGIVYQDGSKFDETYTAFGTVIDGTTVVDAIANVPVTTNPNMQNENSLPVNTVTLIKASIIS